MFSLLIVVSMFTPHDIIINNINIICKKIKSIGLSLLK
ncbi:hypothetical protein SEVCU111_2301 [Staphylococcus epidermidis VCU111]|nr:hypothetical protein SEVCU028_2036 [Staphylococcus epidermidis VCU028]EGS74997.1 hypothetical protein SEVCU105_2142 [Staphylococcus epidermidis VCU105]EGS79867.1 hypothetical protein SEVCU037_2109 [Staphylococcus epidermidis VCU037]EHQ78296.1 hypothetical protein SEVCU057_0310 [Staphylococcus epidermidis VCU057]EHQ81154.1 hypothetical protein SEVCU081_0213 [Staphylococcus epidermidis VCU081]EHR89909.1 hypothetical protein SEVCU125_0403 [Staphylococcus epidermidis VCU125]EHR98322.1 hypothet